MLLPLAPDLPLTEAGRGLGTAEPPLLTARHGSTGGRPLRKDLPPALGQGSHGFVQPAPETPRRRSSTFLGTFCVETPSAKRSCDCPSAPSMVSSPCALVKPSIDLGGSHGLEGHHESFW